MFERGRGANDSVEERRRAIDRPFTSFATWVARWTGSHWAFIAAALLVPVGLLTTDMQTTNLAISVVTLLMVLVLQNTQNRHTAALQLKLDEVVRAEPEARDEIRGVESRPEHEIRRLTREETDDLVPSPGHGSGDAPPAKD